MRKVTIEIDQEGNANVDLAGFHGTGCDKVLKDFTDGSKVRKATNKPEYHQQPRAQEVKC